MDSDALSPDASFANQVFLFTLVCFAVVMLLEALLPRRELQQSMLWRWTNNFSLATLTWYVSTLVSAAFLALLVITQFISYWVHVAFHKIPWLWPLHAMHHTDVDVDVSTSYRLHHCAEQRFTNSNYGGTVPWFDYLFGTASARPFDEQETMALGLKYLRDPREGTLDRLLSLPFQWQQATNTSKD